MEIFAGFLFFAVLSLLVAGVLTAFTILIRRFGGLAKKATQSHWTEARAEAAQYFIQSPANRELVLAAQSFHESAKQTGDARMRAKAIEAHRSILKDEPLVAGAHGALGLLLTDERKDDEALVAFKMAHRLFRAQFDAAFGLHPSERRLTEIAQSIAASHAGMAEALGSIDRRRSLKAGVPTAYESIFGKPPLDSETLVFLSTLGGSADGAEIGQILNEKLAKCSTERFPNAREWVGGYFEEMREQVVSSFARVFPDKIAHNLERLASAGDWKAYGAAVNELRETRKGVDVSRGKSSAELAGCLDAMLASEAARWLDSLPGRGIRFDMLALHSLPPEVKMEITRRTLAALPRRKDSVLTESTKEDEVSDEQSAEERLTNFSRPAGVQTEDDAGVSPQDEELVEKCYEVMRQEKKASASLFQRRLRLSYTRAARILEIMEMRGYVGPGEGGKPREILVDLESEEM